MNGIIVFICVMFGFFLGLFIGCAFSVNKDEEDE